MMLDRRRLLAASSLAGILALTGCGTVTAPQAESDVQLLADGLSGILDSLKALPANLAPPQATLDKIQAELDLIKSDAAKIGTAVAGGGSIVQEIAAAVGAIVPLATPFFPAAPAVAAVLEAGLALLPGILAAVGIKTATNGYPAVMSPYQARLILSDAAAHGVR